MTPGSLFGHAAAALVVGYVLFLLWMAAGLLPVAGFAAAVDGALALAQSGDRPFERWPLLRHLARNV